MPLAAALSNRVKERHSGTTRTHRNKQWIIDRLLSGLLPESCTCVILSKMRSLTGNRYQGTGHFGIDRLIGSRKNIFSMVIVFVLFYPFLSMSEGAEGRRPSFETMRYSVVRIGQVSVPKEKNKIEWLGTGFLIDNRCVFATAKHLFQKIDKKMLVIRFQAPGDKSQTITHDAKLLYEDPTSDLAFLQVPFINDKPCTTGGDMYVFSLVPNYDYFAPGDTVLIIGHPLLTSSDIDLDVPVMRSGIVSSKDLSFFEKEKMLLPDLVGVPGFSGSPVILRDTGYVIGVIYGPGPTERAFGFEWATPPDDERQQGLS